MASPERLSHRSHNFFFFPFLSFPFALSVASLQPLSLCPEFPRLGWSIRAWQTSQPWLTTGALEALQTSLPRERAVTLDFNILSLPLALGGCLNISDQRLNYTLPWPLWTWYPLQQIDKTDIITKILNVCELRGQTLALFQKTLDTHKSVTRNTVCHNTTGAVLLQVSTTCSGH